MDRSAISLRGAFSLALQKPESCWLAESVSIHQFKNVSESRFIFVNQHIGHDGCLEVGGCSR